MDSNAAKTGTSGKGSNSGSSSNYGWLDDYQSGNYDTLPHEEIYSSYRDWSRDASPDEVYESTYQGYQKLPQDQWSGLAADLHGYTQEQGLDLSDLELSDTDYQQWNAQDLARVTSRAYGSYGSQDQEQSKKPEKKEESKGSGGVPKPLIGLALAGALAFAASRMAGGSDKKEEKKDNESYRADSSATSTMSTSDYGRDTTSDSSTSGYGRDMTSDMTSDMPTDYGISASSDLGTTSGSDYGTDISYDNATGVAVDQTTDIASDYSGDQSSWRATNQD